VRVFISPGVLSLLSLLAGLRAQKNAKHRNKGAAILPPQQKTNIIPGLGVDVPELQRARALWQLNRFDEALELLNVVSHGIQIGETHQRHS
jgi:hypothetical protein